MSHAEHFRQPSDCRDISGLCHYLNGTCKSLDEGCREFLGCSEDDLTGGECARIDEEIFRCELCSWWCDAGEQDEDQHCEDCRE